MSELYSIEKILDKQYSVAHKCNLYFVKWKDFPDSENTWEPEENLVPLGKMLEEFNRSYETKKNPPKAQKVSETPVKKPIVSKVKGLVETSELQTPAKKPLEAAFSKSPYLSVEPAKDTNRALINSSVKSIQNTEKKVKKAKKPQPTIDVFGEENVKLITKKNFEKKSVNEKEIDISKNLFKDCKAIKPNLKNQVPWKIIGARKRNNIVQYVVVCKGPPICLPVVLTHEEIFKDFPDLVGDYLLSVIS